LQLGVFKEASKLGSGCIVKFSLEIGQNVSASRFKTLSSILDRIFTYNKSGNITEALDWFILISTFEAFPGPWCRRDRRRVCYMQHIMLKISQGTSLKR